MLGKIVRYPLNMFGRLITYRFDFAVFVSESLRLLDVFVVGNLEFSSSLLNAYNQKNRREAN